MHNLLTNLLPDHFFHCIAPGYHIHIRPQRHNITKCNPILVQYLLAFHIHVGQVFAIMTDRYYFLSSSIPGTCAVFSKGTQTCQLYVLTSLPEKLLDRPQTTHLSNFAHGIR